jgi:hypothetical protein
MKYLALALLVVSVAALAIGCSKRNPEAKSSSWQTYTAIQGGYSFQHPPTWLVEVIPDVNGILVMCPTIEADWQANAFFELRSDSGNRSVAKMLEDLVLNLKKEKSGFALLSSDVFTHPSGLQAGRIEYTHNSDGTKLYDCETVIVIEDNNILFVLTSTASSVKQKYDPIFLKMVDSIKKP